MSQSWNAHWAEDGFRPKRLGNWEVPRWHAQWPDVHCTTTKFEAHKNGRLFTSVKRSDNPWSNFKGTWELPLKIDRKTAEELSKATEYKKVFWDAHRKKHEQICQKVCKGQYNGKNVKNENKVIDENQKVKIKSEMDKSERGQMEKKHDQDTLSKKSNSSGSKSAEKCKIKNACLI